MQKNSAAGARYLVQSSLRIWILILSVLMQIISAAEAAYRTWYCHLSAIWIQILTFNAKNFCRKAAKAKFLVQSSLRDLDPDSNF